MQAIDHQRIWHICHGEPLGELLRHAFGVRVVAILDDCSVGPLTDVDSPFQMRRIDFWCAQVSQRDADCGRAVMISDEIAADRRELAQLDPQATEFVIWSSANAAEQCLLRRALWWLSGHKGSVSVTPLNRQAFEPGGLVANGHSSAARHHLLARFLRRRPLRAADRAEMAAHWLQLRAEHSMLRVWSEGRLQTAGSQKLLLADTHSRDAALPLV